MKANSRINAGVLTSFTVAALGLSLATVGCTAETRSPEGSVSDALQEATNCTADGDCSTCGDDWIWLDGAKVAAASPESSAPIPADQPLVQSGAVRTLSDPVTIITAQATFDAAGTAVIREITVGRGGQVTVGRVIMTIANAARGGMANQAIFSKLVERGIRVVRVSACAGVITWALFAGQLAYAGMEYALGPAAEQMGVRGAECKERVGKAAKGIACLRSQSGTCSDAAKNCGDAFFGPLLETDCALESEAARQQVQGLYTELALAIEGAAALKGGAGSLPAKRQELVDALKDPRKFQSDASIMCSMRDQVHGENGDPKCSIVPGSVYASAPGVLEAKKCWEDAGGLGWGWRIDRAKACCTTNACRQLLGGLDKCW